MMKTINSLLCVALFLGLSSCSPISVRTDYDHEVDFARYQTFKWMPNSRKNRKGVPHNSLLDKRIRRAVENELQAKGLQLVKSGKADALLAYHVGVQKRVDVSRHGYGYWRRHTHVRRYKEGSILVDIVDPRMKQLVWRGAAQGIVGHPDGNVKKINEAIAKVFEKYPPM